MASKQLQSHVQSIALSKPQHSADLHVPINDNEAHPRFNKLQVSGLNNWIIYHNDITVGHFLCMV